MNTLTSEISITRTPKSRIHELDPDNIQFGKKYADHMLQAFYEDGGWQRTEIIPFQNLSLSPATSFIHYGQAIFEGVKAYKDQDGNPVIFRPHDNWKRMNESAARMDMPEIPEEIFMEGMRQLIELDKAWVPSGEATSLYIRPYMVATDEFIGVRPSEKYMFSIISSPAGPYYSKPMSIYVQDQYVRAFPGGTGNIKAAGNYGMSMYPSHMVKNMGYNEILWTDGFEHKYVQEIGTMNVFFVIGDKVITPDLSMGIILPGITRDSVITLLAEKGIKVEERPISIDEIADAYKSGTLKEAFGTGTAASITTIARLTYRENEMVMPDVAHWDTVNFLKKELGDIRHGRVEDTRGWIFKV
jgi:branched-chain amino acid aminotransferase